MEEDIKLKFIKAYNLTMKEKKRIIQDSQEVIELLTNTTQLDIEIENLNDELLVISELLNKLIKENSKSSMSQDDYNKKFAELTNRYEQTQEKHNELIKARDNKKVQALNLKTFISNLKRADDKLCEWNEPVWMLLVKSAVVHRDKSITFSFLDGNHITKVNKHKEI